MTEISRRSVMKTAAWGVPAISLVSMAPAFATSETIPAYEIKKSWKEPGNGQCPKKGFFIQIATTNATDILNVFIGRELAVYGKTDRGPSAWWVENPVGNSGAKQDVLIKFTNGTEKLIEGHKFGTWPSQGGGNNGNDRCGNNNHNHKKRKPKKSQPKRSKKSKR